MARMLTTKSARAGFTLIEVLVISPILIIAIGGFIGLLVSMVGDVLVTRDRNAMTYDTQSAVNRIEEDIKLSTQFLTTSGTQVSPQGSNNNFTGTSAFVNSDNSTLILSAVATDENPASSSRWLVYYANQPNACGSQQTYNRIFLMKIIYFIKNGGLWRRTIVPDFNTNTSAADSNTICPTTSEAVWQKNSCSPGYSGTTRCQTNDELLVNNIQSMNVSYYAKPGDSATLAASSAKDALAVGVTITGQKTTVGESISSSSSVQATRLNNIDNSLPPPAAPTVTYTIDNETDARFSWSTIPTANSYEVSYNINGGSWVNASLNSSTLSYTVNANHRDTVTFKVAAKNVSGTSSYATLSASMPLWSDIDLQNGWYNYSSTYSRAQFARLSSGVVILKGLIKGGTAATDTPIGTLPAGYRPDGRIIFVTSTYTPGGGGHDAGQARLEIRPDGTLVSSETSATWYGFDNVAFPVSGAISSWSSPTFKNSWSNYSPSAGSWQQLRAGKDTEGRVHLQGVVKQSSAPANNTPIANVTSTYRPPQFMLLTAKSNLSAAGGGFVGYGIQTNGDVVTRDGISTSYHSLASMYYPSSFTGWTDLPLLAGWVVYSSTYSSPQYTKASDGIVTLKGLIKSGTNTDGTVIAKLPAGYRPAETKIFPITQSYDFGRVDILASGDVVIRLSSASWTSLDGINFMAEQ